MAPGNGKPRSNGKAASASGSGQHAPLIEDARFARLHTDPRFLRPHRDDAKVTLDDRFKGLLDKSGKGQKSKGKLDKFGRKKAYSDEQRGEDDLHRLYRLEGAEQAQEDDDDSSGQSSDGGAGRVVDYARGEGLLESSGDEDSDSEVQSEEESSDEDEEQGVVIGSASARRRAKKQHTEEESDVDDADLSGVDARELAKLDARAEETVRHEKAKTAKTTKATKAAFGGDTERLAVVNMDWDNIRAIDLFKVFSSIVSASASKSGALASTSSQAASRLADSGIHIVPTGGRCHSVRIYPSEFGRKRMAKENKEGPPRDIFKKADDSSANGLAKAARKAAKSAQSNIRKGKGKAETADSDESSDDNSDEELFDVDEGGDFDEEALRAYQLDRLRYYYAIATFDSAQTARYIMNEIDGTEMEHTANTFDLSFVPKGMTFPEHEGDKENVDDEGWRDEANEQIADAKYEGVDFTTDALRHSRVKLTWDADDPQRSKVTRQLMAQAPTADQLRDEDFRAYLASASEDSASEASDVEDDGGAPKNERMRALLGLTGDEGGQSAFGKARSNAFQDGRKAAGKGNMLEGDMEITFMPGLSEAAKRKKLGGAVDTEESTLDKYKRKQKEKRERRKQGDTQVEGVVDGAPAAAAAAGFDDPFFEGSEDEDVDFDAMLAAEKTKEKKGTSKADRKAIDSVGNGEADDQDLGLAALEDGDDAGHFSLKDIIKAEQAANDGKKKGRWAKKKEKKQAKVRDARNGNEIQPGFNMNVADQRFSTGLFNDHRFALDPSHPSFVKTKGMQQIIEARRDQHRKQQKGSAASSGDRNSHRSNDLDDLVQSVKKRGNGSQGEAIKKRKVRA